MTWLQVAYTEHIIYNIYKENKTMRTTKLAFGYVDKLLSYILKHIVKGRFRHHAEYIGTFVLIYLGMAGGFIPFTMFMGINPT